MDHLAIIATVGDLVNGFSTALTPRTSSTSSLGACSVPRSACCPVSVPRWRWPSCCRSPSPSTRCSAFIMFAGIYYGGLFGDSTTAILMNTPGDPAAIASTFEGHRMAKRGGPARALATAAIGAFVAGSVGHHPARRFFAPVDADLAIMLRPADYFALAVLAFVAVSAVLGASLVRGLSSLLIGLTIGIIGLDHTTGQLRMTFDIPAAGRRDRHRDRRRGPVRGRRGACVGSCRAPALQEGAPKTIPVRRAPGWAVQDFKRSWKPWLRGTALGFPFGAIPAGGAEIPTFLSYVTGEEALPSTPRSSATARSRASPDPRRRTTRPPHGVLVPLLTLGLPDERHRRGADRRVSSSHGLDPGPQLFHQRSPDLIWALLASPVPSATRCWCFSTCRWSAVWAKLLRDSAPVPVRGVSCSSPRSGPTRSTPRRSICCDPAAAIGADRLL